MRMTLRGGRSRSPQRSRTKPRRMTPAARQLKLSDYHRIIVPGIVVRALAYKMRPERPAQPMEKASIYLAMLGLLAAGCHRGGSNDSLQRQQQKYDTVQEGQSSTAVTSTIIAPGEVAPPAAGMTGTNADTTTNFTLPQVSSTSTTPTRPGTLAGTLSIPSNNGPMVGYPSNPPQSRPKPRPPVVTKTEPAKTDTVTTDVNAPPPPTSTTPPTTDTAPPPPSDTQPPPTTTTG